MGTTAGLNQTASDAPTKAGAVTPGADTAPAGALEAERSDIARLPPGVVRQGLRLSIIEGALANVHISLTAGAFLTGFALLLGANAFVLGLIGALPYIGQLFQFAGAYLEARFGERRRLTFWTALTSRGLWGLLAVLPFLDGLGAGRLPVFLVVLALSQVLISIAGNAWTSWMSDLVPPRERGRYFGVRNTVGSVTAMASTWLAGYVLDHYRASGDQRVGYLVVFGVAVVCAMAAAAVLARQPEPPMLTSRSLRLAELFGTPLRQPRFRAFALASTGWALVTGIASPFFSAYGLQSLRLSFATLALTGVVTAAVALITQPVIGRLQDRFGNERVLVASVIGVVLLPWGWILSTPGFLLPLWLTAIFSGVFWPGITQGLINMLMDRASPTGRGAYVATYGAITGAGTFVAGVVGGTCATLLGATIIHLGPIRLDHYAILFALSSLGRAIMAVVFARKV